MMLLRTTMSESNLLTQITLMPLHVVCEVLWSCAINYQFIFASTPSVIFKKLSLGILRHNTLPIQYRKKLLFALPLPVPPSTRNKKTMSWSILATCQKLFLLFVAWRHVWYFPCETVNMCKNSILDGHLTNRFGVISLFAKLCRSILYSK